MSSRVFIAEKPSVAKNIADALGAKTRKDGYYEGPGCFVTWAFGHLLELFDVRDYDPSLTGWRMETFPFVPQSFTYKVKHKGQTVDAGAQKQLETIKTLIDRDDVIQVVSATDFDREGQIIGDIVLEYLKVDKPIYRLLLNEWTPKEVAQGLNKLVDNTTMKPLRDAGISRQWADWLIGINLTSVATLKYQRGKGKALNVGRVLLPTLKIIYDRDLEIEAFIPEEYHKLTLQFKTAGGDTYTGIYTEQEDKFENKAYLEGIRAQVKGKDGQVSQVQKEVKREYPPVLFNLSGLQGYITSKNKGWSSDKVLKVAQALYEKKLITYPRTASLALEESLIDKAKQVLSVHKKGLPYEDEIAFHTHKRVFDNDKVESHSAIMPTYLVAKGLSLDEQIVYQAVKNRFIMQFMPVAEHEETQVITQVMVSPDPDLLGHFVSKGRVQLIEGWRKVEKIKSKANDLPPLQEGQPVSVSKSKLETKGTKPPKKHTEQSLLKVMETCGKHLAKKQKASLDEDDQDEDEDGADLEGVDVTHEETQEEKDQVQAILSGFSIGTPATRAETISKLLRIGYIERKGKALVCTQVGRNMVEMFPIASLFDLEYTGRLEKTLSDISKNEASFDDFMDQMVKFTSDAVSQIKTDVFHVIQDLDQGRQQAFEGSLGPCPTCGSPVVETEKAFGCTNWKGGCKYTIWKNDKYLQALKVSPSAHTIKRLLENGQVCSNRFTNKKGEHFAACLTYVKQEDSAYYRWEMTFM